MCVTYAAALGAFDICYDREIMIPCILCKTCKERREGSRRGREERIKKKEEKKDMEEEEEKAEAAAATPPAAVAETWKCG